LIKYKYEESVDNMKKKIAFFANKLGIGGIGRAIINYVNMIDKDKYDVTLFLNHKEGMYLDEVDSKVKVISLDISESKNLLIRKVKNAYVLLKNKLKYYHKFDFAANFHTTIKAGAILAKYFSKNNAFWFHGEYFQNQEEAVKFFNYTTVERYKKVVFVSYHSKEIYEKYTKNKNQKLYVINNPINYEEIIEKSKIDVGLKKERKILLNVGRHEEAAKNLSLLIKTVAKLINEKYEFELWLVGIGKDTDLYKKMVKDLNIDEYVKFFGEQNNVFPYYKISDAVILSSVMEGNPVVYLEAKILNKPIISTDVADASKELDGYGIVTDLDFDSFYVGVKNFLDNGYEIKHKFNPAKHNQEVLAKLYSMIEGE